MLYAVSDCSFHPSMHIKDYQGRTAVDRARERGYNDIAEFISSYKPLPRGELILNEINSLAVSCTALMFCPNVEVMITS